MVMYFDKNDPASQADAQDFLGRLNTYLAEKEGKSFSDINDESRDMIEAEDATADYVQRTIDAEAMAAITNEPYLESAEQRANRWALQFGLASMTYPTEDGRDATYGFTPPNRERYSMEQTNLSDIAKGNDAFIYNQQRSAAFHLGRLQNSSTGIGQWMSRTINGINSATLEPREATDYARQNGVDIKFSKPVTVYHVHQAMETARFKRGLEEITANIYNGSRKRTAWQNGAILASGLAGGISVPEVGVSLAGSIFLPGAILSTVGKAAGLVDKALKSKKVYDMILNSRRMQTALTVLGDAARTVPGSLDDVTALFIDANKAANMPLSLKKWNDAQTAMSKLRGLRYDQMEWYSKGALDAGVFMAVDYPFILANQRNSEDLGVELYTQKDAAIDVLTAGILGVVVPGTAGALGRIFGRSPLSVQSRRLKNAKLEVRNKVVKGEITKEEGDELAKRLDEADKMLRGVRKVTREPNPYFENAAEQIRRVNITDEDLNANIMYAVAELKNGRRPQLVQLPSFEAAYSHIHADTLGRLRVRTLREVFGDAIRVTETKNGLFKVSIPEETGFLGRRPITALTQAEAEEAMRNMYRGLVLREPDAMRAFTNHAERMTRFWDDLTDIIRKYDEQKTTNVTAARAREETPLKRKDILDLRNALQTAFLRYKLGEDGLSAYRKIRGRNIGRRIKGEDPISMPEEYTTALNEFEEWYGRHVEEHETSTGYLARDFKNGATGKRDYGTNFKAYLNELRNGAEETATLERSELYLQDMVYSPEQFEQMVDSIMKGEVTADNDLNLLFGSPRRNIDELRELNTDNLQWRNELSLRKMDMATREADPATNRTLQQLDRYTVPDADRTLKSMFNTRRSTLRILDTQSKEGYPRIRESLLKQFSENKQLTQAIEKSIAKGVGYTRAVRLSILDCISNAIQESDLVDYIPQGSRIFANQSLQVFENEVRRNPELLENLLDPIDRATTPGTTIDIEDAAAGRAASLGKIIEPIMLGVDNSVSQIKLRALNDIRAMADLFDLAKKNPEIADQIFSGKATQTIYTFEGSNRSLEYTSKTYGAWIRDIQRQCMTEETGAQEGLSLWQYLHNEDNLDSIKEALIRLSHGEEIQENTDAARVAKILDNNLSSFAAQLRRFGIEYMDNSLHTKKDKLKAADAFISDDMMDDFYANLKGLEVSVDKVMGDTPIDEVRGVRYGDEFADITEEKVVDDIQAEYVAAHKSFIDSVNKLQELNNNTDRKLAMMFFKNLDLDHHFDPGQTMSVSLNDIRDALMSGDWTKITNEDARLYVSAAKDFKSFVDKMIGTYSDKDAAGKIMLGSDGFIFKQKMGLFDLSSAATGRENVGLNGMLYGLRFKNADAELEWARRLGYDNMTEYMESNFDNIFKAYYSTEMFGSHPARTGEELVTAFNNMIKGDREFREEVAALMRLRGEDPEKMLRKMAISPGAARSINTQIVLACGLQNEAPSAAVRFIRILMSFATSGMLIKAGIKSLADYTTIGEGLLNNAYAAGRLEAAQMMAHSAGLMARNPDVAKLVVASNLIQQEELYKLMTNNPSANFISQVSENATWLDKLEVASNKWGNFMMNSLGRMSQITNSNKMNAALAIQYAVGKQRDIAFKDLPVDMQNALYRDAISERDWDFLRVHGMTNISDYMKSYDVDFPKSSYDEPWFIPQRLLELPDEIFREEMVQRGIRNITPTEVENFKMQLVSKGWNLVESSSSQFVSIPSGRIMNILRGGFPRNSFAGASFELGTQYQAFGLASVYNTFGRRLANAVARETGITILDLFNPRVKLYHGNRWAIASGVLQSLFTIFSGTLAVNTMVNMLSGNIQKPYDDKGWHGDAIMEAALGSMGIAGTLIDAGFSAMTGVGQRGGGISLQVAPSISNLARYVYRFYKIGSSKEIQDKGSAFAAELGNSIARATGLKTGPVLAPAFQYLIGAWLDMQAAGGSRRYNERLRYYRDRGYVIMPYQEEPVPFWDTLSN